MVQCLIVSRFGLQLQGVGSSPLTKLTSKDVIDLWSLLGPNLTMEGSLLAEGPFSLTVVRRSEGASSNLVDYTMMLIGLPQVRHKLFPLVCYLCLITFHG